MRTVAWREIRAASRRQTTYWSRTISGGVAGAVLLILMLQVSLAFITGRTLFMTAVWVAFLLCLLEGVRQASTSIVEERVEGTLGLLLLTRVRGGELLLGKFAALMFFAAQTLLAVAPVVAMSLLMGGVSALEVIRAALALTNTLVVALTVGLVISARSREPSRAMFGTFFALGIGTVLLMLSIWPVMGRAGFVLGSLNPLTPFRRFEDLSYKLFWKEYWLSIIFTLGIASLALWRVSARVSVLFATESGRQIDLTPAFTTTGDTIDPEASLSHNELTEWRTRVSKRWFEGNPIEWLCLRHLNLHRRQALPAVMALVIGFVLASTQFMGFLIFLVLYLIFGFVYSASAVATLARARQTGELELWLTTPLTVTEIVTGQLRVLRKAFVWPGMILLSAWCWMFCRTVLGPLLNTGANGGFSVTVSGPGGSSAVGTIWPIFYLIGATIFSMTSLLFALPYVAMWIALKTKTPAQAAMRTFLFLFIAPSILLWVPKVLIFAPLGMVASHSVKKLLKDYGSRVLRN